MRLTEVRIKLCEGQAGRLKAFCSLTFDHSFVVRDVKLIDGNEGLFLAMPARKICDHCARCGEKNHLRARYCANCGCRLNENRSQRPAMGNGQQNSQHSGQHSGQQNGHQRAKLHADIAHPINADARREIESQVLAAYWNEVEKSKQPGYIAPNLDGEDMDLYDIPPSSATTSPPAPARLRTTGTPI